MLCCLAAGMLTSCLNDDDDNEFSYEQQLEAFQTVAGNYTGRVLFYDRKVNSNSTSADQAVDTLDVSWTMRTDSTARINSFPLKAIAHQISDTTVAKALENATPQYVSIDLATRYYSLNPVAFIMAPGSVSTSVNYDGGTHPIDLGFFYGSSATNGLLSYGAYNSSNRTLMMRMQLGRVTIDGVDKTSTALFQDGIHGVFVLSATR